MKFFLLFLSLVCFATVAYAAGTSSNQEHSETYLKLISGEFNADMYLSQTFLGTRHDYRCIVLPDDRGELRRRYIEILEELGIECEGDWCVNGKFKCHHGDSKECYNVEHIVDLKNSVLDGYNKNILGNLVMAYGRWNQEMGSMVWTKVEVEKRYVYGNSIVDEAISNIAECADNPGDDPDELVDSDGGHIKIKFSTSFLFSIGTLMVLCVGLFIWYHRRFRHQDVPGGSPVGEFESECSQHLNSEVESDTTTSDEIGDENL